MAYPANLVNVDGGKYANLGTAKHEVSAGVLTKKLASAESVIGVKIKAGADEFIIDDEFAQHVTYYTDEIERRAMGATLMVEQKVSLHGWEGFTKANYGTSDAVIAHEAKIADETTGLEIPAYGEVCDAKFGSGVKVYAWEYAKPNDPFTMDMFPEGSEEPTLVVPNYQLMTYAVASLKRIELLVGTVSHINIVIIQPPLNSISELRVPRAVLERFALFAAQALKRAEHAKAVGWDRVTLHWADYLNPGEKQCTWCKAFATCPAAAKRVETDVASDFDVIAEQPPTIGLDTKSLGKYFAAVPFVLAWTKAVLAEVNSAVSDGKQVIGSDGKPLKFVEGDLGDRKWESEDAAKDALLGVLSFDKVYTEPKVISAPAAAKLLDKKATKQTWKDVFEPMIKRAPGKPKLALGSDPRPPYIPVATSDEFEVQE
jgi:hypothetical protein